MSSYQASLMWSHKSNIHLIKWTSTTSFLLCLLVTSALSFIPFDHLFLELSIRTPECSHTALGTIPRKEVNIYRMWLWMEENLAKFLCDSLQIKPHKNLAEAMHTECSGLYGSLRKGLTFFFFNKKTQESLVSDSGSLTNYKITSHFYISKSEKQLKVWITQSH